MEDRNGENSNDSLCGRLGLGIINEYSHAPLKPRKLRIMYICIQAFVKTNLVKMAAVRGYNSGALETIIYLMICRQCSAVLVQRTSARTAWPPRECLVRTGDDDGGTNRPHADLPGRADCDIRGLGTREDTVSVSPVAG